MSPQLFGSLIVIPVKSLSLSGIDPALISLIKSFTKP